MRRSIVMFALCVAMFVRNQHGRNGTHKRNLPSSSEEQTIFKEWAKGIRETSDIAKLMQKTQAANLRSRVARSTKDKEDKLRARYRLSPYQLFLIVKCGVAEKWPTDNPGDLSLVEPIVAQRQAHLDATIFEEELNAWVENQMPPRQSPSGRGATEVVSDHQRAALDGNALRDCLRKKAPITVCTAKLPNGKTCHREVVGKRGQQCYEHRDVADGADK